MNPNCHGVGRPRSVHALNRLVWSCSPGMLLLTVLWQNKRFQSCAEVHLGFKRYWLFPGGGLGPCKFVFEAAGFYFLLCRYLVIVSVLYEIKERSLFGYGVVCPWLSYQITSLIDIWTSECWFKWYGKQEKVVLVTENLVGAHGEPHQEK